MTKVVFFGTGPVAAASLRFIAQHFNVEAVVTKPRAPGHKGSVPVEELASELNLPTYFASNKSELDGVIASQTFSSPCGIVVDFGIIISQNVIDSFPFGIINSHFSLLPQWRGADPITYTVLSGQEKTGVSLMVIDAGLDTGKLITRRSLHLAPKETTDTLTGKLVELSNTLLLEYLDKYLSGEVKPKNQPHPDRVTHSHKIHKSDAALDWNEPAEVIERKIRAYQPWPKARTKLGNVEIILLDGDIVENENRAAAGTVTIDGKRLIVACGEGALSVATLQPLGKKEMPVSAFLAGYRSQLGI